MTRKVHIYNVTMYNNIVSSKNKVHMLMINSLNLYYTI
jgi:hypothetical protein